MRIIAGKYKAKVLNSPKTEKTRPTLDRVKEALFSMIMPYLNDAIILHLFAGTGNLGIEALSRGAKFVYFNDNNNDAIKVIYSNGDYDVGILESIDSNEDDTCYIFLSDSYNRILEIKLDRVIKVDIVNDFRHVDYDDEEFNCHLSDEEFDEFVRLLKNIGLYNLGCTKNGCAVFATVDPLCVY